jgi:hypothetical protein
MVWRAEFPSYCLGDMCMISTTFVLQVMNYKKNSMSKDMENGRGKKFA